jgi:drug/metabolite transporter (DMT)-like permease
MHIASLLRLILLAAIWGGSFLFMRISAPVLGPAVLIECRVLCAALFLAIVGVLLKKRLALRGNWKHYFVLGFFNSAFPFLLFAYAARTLPASVLAVLNATAPMWGALLGALPGPWSSRQSIQPRTALGLLLGMAGVALLVGFDHATSRPGAALAVGAALLASLCYSVASQYARSARSIEPFANAHGTMWTSAVMVLPALALFPPAAAPTAGVIGAVVALGVVCSGIAYLLYFRLIDEVGPTSALTVTFLSPVFGILWGALFLGERIGWYTVAGSAIVLLGTALVTGFLPRPRAEAVAR